MSGKATKEEIKAALAVYLEKHLDASIQSVYDEATDCYQLKDKNDVEIIIGPGLKCMDEGILKELREVIMESRQNVPEAPRIEDQPKVDRSISTRKEKASLGAMVKPDMTVRDIQVADLTIQDIKDYICSTATNQEAFMFLKLCQARNLNPFTREAYLIKYGDKVNMIVGKEAFTRKAEMNPQFDGFKAGIILKDEPGMLIWREGCFIDEGQKLVGGWAEVYRKDRTIPFKAEVSLKEYSKSQATWKDMPAVMIRKVALVSALREAFPSDLAGCYDASELGINPEKEVRQEATPS